MPQTRDDEIWMIPNVDEAAAMDVVGTAVGTRVGDAVGPCVGAAVGAHDVAAVGVSGMCVCGPEGWNPTRCAHPCGNNHVLYETGENVVHHMQP
jgi:hypothetical protein